MPPTFSTAGELYWGAIHAHSTISRCSGPKSDGAPDDMYIFARDGAGLDFFAITDHDNDLMLEDRWERAKAAADEFSEPGRFVTLPAYEWTSWPYGHLNVYYLDSDAPLLPCSETGKLRDPNGYTPGDLWASLRQGGLEAMTIPHHVAVTMFRTQWDYYDPEFQPVTEIVSGWGRFEYYGNEPPVIGSDTLPGYFVQDALERGYRLGIIGGSDSHDGRPAVPGVHWRSGPAGKGLNPTITGRRGNPLGVQPAQLIGLWKGGGFARWRGLAAVYAPELTREAVFRAIQSRRCYGTSGARILLDYWLNGHPMGDIATLDDPGAAVTLQVRARGTDLVDRVDVIKNGQLVYRHTEEESLSASFSWTDPEVTQPDNYYYVRARQADGHTAWSSPIWVSWACYDQVPGHREGYTDWPVLLEEFHQQQPGEPDISGQDAALAVWQAPLGQAATRLCLRWRGAEGEVCAGNIRLPAGVVYRLRDRDLSIVRFGGDLYTDDGQGRMQWHAGCGSAWRGFDVAVVGGGDQDVFINAETLPDGAALWVNGQEYQRGPLNIRLTS
jgi:hypothetical protein